jgi:hypothetical protein
MSKYYTPEIEEFHVGFEFEALFTDNKKEPNLRWVKMNEPFQFKRLYEWLGLPEPGLRVKYLDRKDIESLGFVYDKTSKESQWKFRKNNIMLYYRPISLQLGTFTIDHMKSDFIMEYSKDNKMISLLTIKNKSELKRLLKQLSI